MVYLTPRSEKQSTASGVQFHQRRRIGRLALQARMAAAVAVLHHGRMHAGGLFVSSDYLDPLEQCGCATPARGWTPLSFNGSATAGARVPLYAKTHSWGEFVFDQSLAGVWQRNGLAYYPKLVVTVPFTPVPGPRLLADTDTERQARAAALQALARGYSGVHLLFVDDDDRRVLSAAGWSPRAQPRYVWHRRGAQDFDQFLARLDHKRRKNIRSERRRVAGFDIRWQAADCFSAHEWQRLHALYASTYVMRGQSPYLTLDCLREWAARFGERMQIVTAGSSDGIAAMALYFVDGDTLYGRHWGADADYHSLHFELCYYQGIDYCLRHSLEHFDAGVQGEHKRHRGFDAELAWSMHWFTHPALHAAVTQAFAQELRSLLPDDSDVERQPRS